MRKAQEQRIFVHMTDDTNMADPLSPYKVYISLSDFRRDRDLTNQRLFHELAHAVYHRDHLSTDDLDTIFMREVDARIVEGISYRDAVQQTLFYYPGLAGMRVPSSGFGDATIDDYMNYLQTLLRNRASARDFRFIPRN
jgi:hypothetical protein